MGFNSGFKGLIHRSYSVHIIKTGKSFFFNHIQTVSGTFPPPHTMGTGGFCMGARRPEFKANHSPSSNIKINTTSYVYTHVTLRLVRATIVAVEK